MIRTSLLAAGFLACMPVANWMIGHVGTVCVPDGPCLIPAGPGLMAPSGSVMIGVALVLRDLLHERIPRRAIVGLIGVSAILSTLAAPASIAFASAASVFFSELLDFAVYDRLRQRGRAMAVLMSGLAGTVLDSVLFVWLAFGVVTWAPGQILLKLYASLAYSAWLVLRGRKVLA